MTPLVNCAFCGRENEPLSRFCFDCGKPVSASAARVIPATSGDAAADAGASALTPPTRVSPAPGNCPRCAKPVDPSLSFCGHCGTKTTSKTTSSTTSGSCNQCGATYTEGVDVFCARCGARVGKRVSMEIGSAFGTLVLGSRSRNAGPTLSVLDEAGDVQSSYVLDRGEAVVGRGDADIRFDDVYQSPMHARFELRDGELWVRDLGSRNGTWTYIDQSTRLADCDIIMVGSQLIRFRRLGYPGPHPPEADSTRRMGSLVPSADVAVLEQLRADGSVRDSFHLSPARTVVLGRESGDWVFPYDQTMSGRHAEVRSQDAEFFAHDAGSRNGVALAVRGERALKKGQRILIGDKVLRVESIGS